MQVSVTALLEDLKAKAETIEEHGRVALLERFGPKIRTDRRRGRIVAGWIAILFNWDTGDPIGVSITERGAILNLLEKLEDEEATP